MSIIQERIARVEAAIHEIENHCMSRRVVMSADSIMVYLPEGYEVDGVRASWDGNKGEILEKVAAKLEQIWKESFF